MTKQTETTETVRLQDGVIGTVDSDTLSGQTPAPTRRVPGKMGEE